MLVVLIKFRFCNLNSLSDISCWWIQREWSRLVMQPARQRWEIHTKYLPENFQSKDYSRYLEVDDKIILKCVARRLGGWKVRGSNPGRSVRFLSTRKCPNRLWGATCLLFNGYRGYFSGVSDRSVKLTSYLHLMQRLWMSGTNPLVPLYTSMTWTGKTLHIWEYATFSARYILHHMWNGKMLCALFIQ